MQNIHNPPRAYDLQDPREKRRLIVEVLGYLRTCRTTRCGGDFEGRAFAMDALEELLKRETSFQFNRTP